MFYSAWLTHQILTNRKAAKRSVAKRLTAKIVEIALNTRWRQYHFNLTSDRATVSSKRTPKTLISRKMLCSQRKRKMIVSHSDGFSCTPCYFATATAPHRINTEWKKWHCCYFNKKSLELQEYLLRKVTERKIFMIMDNVLFSNEWSISLQTQEEAKRKKERRV